MGRIRIMKAPVRTSAAIACATPAASAIIIMAAVAAATQSDLHPSPRGLSAVVFRPAMRKVPEVTLDELKDMGHLKWVVGADTKAEVLTGVGQHAVNGETNGEANIAAGVHLGMGSGSAGHGGTNGNVHETGAEEGGSKGLIQTGAIPESNVATETKEVIETETGTEIPTAVAPVTGTKDIIKSGANVGINTGMILGTGDKTRTEGVSLTETKVEMKPGLVQGTQMSAETEPSASGVESEKLDLLRRNETWKNGLVSGSSGTSTQSAATAALKELQEALEVEQAAAAGTHPRPGGSTKTQPLRRNLQCSSSSPGVFGCCAPISVPQIGFMQSVCLNLSVHLDTASATVNLLLNGNSLVETTFSANNPAPLCVPVPQFPPLTLCIRAYGLGLVGGALRVCINLEAQLAGVPLLVISFDCVRVGPGGVTLEPRPPSVPAVALLPGLLPSSNRAPLLAESTTGSTVALTQSLDGNPGNSHGLKLAPSTVGQKSDLPSLAGKQDLKDQNTAVRGVSVSLKPVIGEYLSNSASLGPVATLHADQRSRLIDESQTSPSVGKQNQVILNGSGISTNPHISSQSRFDQIEPELPVVGVHLKSRINGSLHLGSSKSASIGNIQHDGTLLLESPHNLGKGVNSLSNMNKLLPDVRVRRSLFSPQESAPFLHLEANSELGGSYTQDKTLPGLEPHSSLLEQSVLHSSRLIANDNEAPSLLDENETNSQLTNGNSAPSNHNGLIVHSKVRLQLGESSSKENNILTTVKNDSSLRKQNSFVDPKSYLINNTTSDTYHKYEEQIHEQDDISILSQPNNINVPAVHSVMNVTPIEISSIKKNTFLASTTNCSRSQQNLLDYFQVRCVTDTPRVNNKSSNLVNITFENQKNSPNNETFDGKIPNEKREHVTFPVNFSFPPFRNSINASLKPIIPSSLPTLQNKGILTRVLINSSLPNMNNSKNVDTEIFPHSGSTDFSLFKNVFDSGPLHAVKSKTRNENTSSNDVNVQNFPKNIFDLPTIVEGISSKVNKMALPNPLTIFPKNAERERNYSPFQNSPSSTEIHNNLHSPVNTIHHDFNLKSNIKTDPDSVVRRMNNVLSDLTRRTPSIEEFPNSAANRKSSSSSSSLLPPLDSNFHIIDHFKSNPLLEFLKFPNLTNPLKSNPMTESEITARNVEKPRRNDGISVAGEFNLAVPSISSGTEEGEILADTNKDDRGYRDRAENSQRDRGRHQYARVASRYQLNIPTFLGGTWF